MSQYIYVYLYNHVVQIHVQLLQYTIKSDVTFVIDVYLQENAIQSTSQMSDVTFKEHRTLADHVNIDE